MVSSSWQGINDPSESDGLTLLGFGTRSHAFAVTLPPPLYLPWAHLLALYAILWCVDYLVIRYVSKRASVKCILAAIHFAMPLAWACPEFYVNACMVCGPWVVGAQVIHEAEQARPLGSLRQSSVRDILPFLIDDKAPMDNDANVRVRGVAKIMRGVFKWSLMKAAVDPLLERVPEMAGLLDMAYFSIPSVWITVLLGTKVYCLLGVVDIATGAQQLMLGLPMLDLFDSPWLASGPRDFWSRRWNRPVHKILHQHFFPIDTPRSQYTLRGFACFVASGLFHEVMLAALVRKVSLDQVVFFVIQGVAVLAEVKTIGQPSRKEGRQILGRRAVHFLFLALTGRLFLAPYLRSGLFEKLFR
ncbi:hypothetical protein BX666DRAFT_649674 [Dichotomocladium elegans]|nr:hypothetical protein BX666DRAFT_649674 [Dichotomocladium elegans]